MQDSPQDPERFRVGDLIVDLATFRVTDHDREIPMPKLTFDLLAALARHAPAVVSIDTLMDEVWGDVVVAEETVGQRVKLVRDALGENRRDYIATVRGRGFRLAARVRPMAVADEGDADSVATNQGGASNTASQKTTDATPAESQTRETAEPERRQLTVMDCRLVGTATLEKRVGLETLRELTRSYQQQCAAVVTRFDGHIARFMGDGLLIYFGYPRAHEEDAERAVRAGLEIVRTIAALSADRDDGIDLSVRIGIATGVVLVGDLVGDDASEQEAVVGTTPTLATNLNALASGKDVVISTETLRLLGKRFSVEDLGEHEIQGFDIPVRAWRVCRKNPAASRFTVTHPGRLTPLAGRRDEIDLLQRRWLQAKTGEGQVVLLCGEPGIGKSRLAHDLRKRLATESNRWLDYQCSPYHTSSALYPFMRQIEHAAGLAREDSNDTRLDKLEALFADAIAREPLVVPLVASLLSLPTGDRYAPIDLNAQTQKRETMRALMLHLECLASRQPALLIFEDAHWIDPTSQEMLDSIVDRIETMPVLALLTFRPEYQAPWTGASHVTAVSMNRLSSRHTADMLAGIDGVDTVPGELRERIVARADGIPLFVEELAQTVLASDVAAGATAQSIPSTLQDSLTARLDQLGAAKDVAQIASVIGREFGYKLLAAVADIDPGQLNTALDANTSSGLISQRGVVPEASYTFKHALIQDAAYQGLLTARRRRHHARIAKAIEEQFPDRAESEPEILAHHYTEAMMPERALAHWQRAGERAVAQSANVEAIAHLEKGLAALRHVPDGAGKDRHELALRITLGPPLQAVAGYASVEAKESYLRARELWERLGERIDLCPILYGLWEFYASTADYPTARDTAREMLNAAEAVEDRGYVLDGHLALACTLFFMGKFEDVHKHGKLGGERYDPGVHHAHALQRPAVLCPMFDGLSLWSLGYPQQGLSKAGESIQRARQLSHPFTLAVVLTWSAMFNQRCGDASQAMQHADEAARLSQEYGFSFWVSAATMVHGWALAEQGQILEGCERVRDGLQNFRSTGSLSFLTYGLLLYSEIERKAGRADKAMQLLCEASDVAEQLQEHYLDAELQRSKGELLLIDPTLSSYDAESCFRTAVDIARRQSARMLELRAATNLARLWCSRGNNKDAAALLTPIYDSFDEGFETSDLANANAVLESCRAGRAQEPRTGAGRSS